MKVKPIGIDLGTTFSAVATINSAGKPEIITNSDGDRITASAAYFESEGRIQIGNIALEMIVSKPDRIVRWVKREMGNTDYAFKVDGKNHSAVDISSYILKKLTQDVATVFPDNEIKKVVITVPAYFDEYRRKATMDAAKKAGLEVLRIINEPTAAALAYASQGHIKGKTLIYDFGGGTFDVSIVDIISPTDIKVLSSDGDHQLGGYDIDKLIGKFFADKYSKKLMSDDKIHEAIYGTTLKESERAKKNLSKSAKTEVLLVDGVSPYNCVITKEEFEGLIKDILVRTEMLIESALVQAVIASEDLKNVILVGGSTRIPAVKEMLKRKLNLEPISSINPDEAVALGAAIQAGILIAEDKNADLSPIATKILRSTKLSDVANHSFGTLAVDDITNLLRNDILIPKNTPLPTSKTKDFYTNVDNQTKLECSITQGEDQDPQFVNIIAEEIMELPHGRPKGSPIRITYIYDANGRMSCSFHDLGSGLSKVISPDLIDKTRLNHEFSDSDFDGLNIT